MVCHTYAICCGNKNTIWLTAVRTTHKEDRIVPSHFHSWFRVYFPRMVCYEGEVLHKINLKKAEYIDITDIIDRHRQKQDELLNYLLCWICFTLKKYSLLKNYTTQMFTPARSWHIISQQNKPEWRYKPLPTLNNSSTSAVTFKDIMACKI